MSSDSSRAAESNGFLDPPREADELGRLGPYRVLETLGSGGMGRVFRAEDTRLQRPVALKVMNAQFAAIAGSRQRFLQEARAMAAVHHDNVVTIFEVGERKGTPFLAMELLQGATLEELLERGETFDVERIVRLAVGVCHGLQAAHDRGIVHRDVKPGNIWIQSPSHRPKLLDFGLALATGPVEQIAGAGSVTGTPGYLSPEQARIEPLDNRSDLYSLGVVLFEVCTGRLPFVVKPAQRMLISVIADPAPEVHQLNPEIPLPLSQLIGHLLSKEARDRPASAQAVAVLLEEVAEQCRHTAEQSLQGTTDEEGNASGNEAAPNADSGPAAAASPTPDGEHPMAPSPPTERWRRWQVLGLAGALFLVIMGVSGITWILLTKKVASEKRDDGAAETAQATASIGAESVSPESLRTLQIEELSVSRDPVPVGENLTVTFALTNTAEGREQNPAVIHASRDIVARVSVYLQPDGGPRRPADAFPLRRSPSQLPLPGQQREQTILVGTNGLDPGPYTIAAVLETPDGKWVSEAATPVTLTAAD